MMTNTHVFNEELKRLEPIFSKCMYCDSGELDSLDDILYIPLFKENDRTNIIVYRQVKFSKIMIGIARCPHCRKIHKSSTITARLIGWGLSIVFVIIAFIVLFSVNSVWGLLSFIGSILAHWGSFYLEKQLTRRKGIEAKQDGAKKYEIVQRLISEGWSFNQPAA